jgi:PAS domain-containing protein
VSSSLHSARTTDTYGELLRRFVEAARRAQIVTIVNRAQTEQELGDLVSAELCEAFDAEVAIVLAGSDGRPFEIVGCYGLAPDEAERLLEQDLLAADATRRHDGSNLLSVGGRALVCAPFGSGGLRGVVGVARFYDQSFDEAEAALLEAVAASICHALERLRLAEERDQLYREAHERGKAARVIGSIADGVLLVDESEIVRLWNPAAEAITRLPHDAVIGRSLDEALPGWRAVAGTIAAAGDPAASPLFAATVPVDV